MKSGFEHPWFLLLLILFFLNQFFRKSKYFLKHADIQSLVNSTKKSRWGSVLAASPSFLKELGCLLLILAAADYGLYYQENWKKTIIHKYVLLDDGSSSMVDATKPKGIGQELTDLLEGNDRFLKALEELKRPDQSRDLVSAMVFSDDPYIVCYLTEDYDFVRKKLSYVDWRQSPLNSGTEIDKAFWVGLKLILKNNYDKGGAFFSEDEFVSLETRLKGQDRILNLDQLPETKRKVEQIKKEIRGSSLVAFTDGFIIFDGDQLRMSVPKILSFLKELGVRAYLISVERISLDFLKYIQATGGRGIIIRSLDLEKITSAYKEIVDLEAGEFLTINRRLKKSYSHWLAMAGLALLTIYSVLRNTVSRSLTEI